MEDNELLEAIKTRLGITGTYHDGLLMAYAEDVKAYMVSGGVKNRIVNDVASVGCIARGVADLWNYGAGDGKFSEVFYQRVIQLAMPSAGIEDGSDEYDAITDEEIKDIVSGDSTTDYNAISDEEIMDIVNSDTPEPENPEISVGEDEYEALTDDEILDLIQTI